MSTEALAMFRKSLGPELSGLAEEHLKHDLTPSDRSTLLTAAQTVSTHTSIGSALGLSLALFLAYRMRTSRRRLYATLKTAEQPKSIIFASGREEALPDLRPLLRPSTAGDIATFGLLGLGGLFFGGEMGLLTGSFRARQTIGADRESRERIELAWRKFRADALRAQAGHLERGEREGLYNV